MKFKNNKDKTRTITLFNGSDLPHSDFHMVPINANLDNYKSRINIQKQKIILKKASYICPEASWETGSIKNNKNKVYNDNEKCSMCDEQTTNAALSMTCISIRGKNCKNLLVKHEEIYFAKHFHERLTITQNTWALYAKHVKYFSDLQGVCQVLGCYNSMDEIYLGERCGYRLYAEDVFNYIKGGGGIAFSLSVVKLILQHCRCPSATAPDDMILWSLFASTSTESFALAPVSSIGKI
ncbi:hypothetical protein FF38_13647 [Lucilia cuprina]|uniref:Fringe-like glycosyltransferase domain-containing protein n=1 Tax=Lucilia cuprina TaxID=7375 RepID=A0A0L0CFS3_LUCCU|nr:hypothetical protein FF38_13647 [Lucilia cuprina]